MHVRPTPPTHARPGNPEPAALAHTPVPREGFFLAPHDRPPLAGVKLVRPRPRLSARRCGRSSLTPAARRHKPAATRKSHNHSPAQAPATSDKEVTGLNQHALLTAGVPMGAISGCLLGVAVTLVTRALLGVLDAKGDGDALVGRGGLAVDAVGVDLEQDGDAVPGATDDLSGGHPGVQPQRDGGVPQIIRTPAERQRRRSTPSASRSAYGRA